MDWSTFISGIVAGLIVNLLTPSVRVGFKRLFYWSESNVKNIGTKSLTLRLKQLSDEYEYIKSLHDNPNKFIFMLAAEIMTVVMVTWVVILIVFFSDIYHFNGTKITYLTGGLLGVGTRYFLSMLIAWRVSEKVVNFEKFEKSTRGC